MRCMRHTLHAPRGVLEMEMQEMAAEELTDIGIHICAAPLSGTDLVAAQLSSGDQVFLNSRMLQ